MADLRSCLGSRVEPGACRRRELREGSERSDGDAGRLGRRMSTPPSQGQFLIRRPCGKAFRKDMNRVDGILARNMDQANAFGFDGTPAFIIGTRIYHGAMDRQAPLDAIAAALES